MHYDPIKKMLGNAVSHKVFARVLFYRLLDMLLLRTWHIRREIRLFARTQHNALEVLDAGSGFGQYSWWLAGKFRNWIIKGIDVKQDQVDDCNIFFRKAGKTNAHFFCDDLAVYKEPQTYDLIISVDVMEHIEDDMAVFRNFCESLKPGGMLLISTPSDQGGSDVHSGNQTSFIEEHVRVGYNVEEIQQKLIQAGFSKTEARYQYGKPGGLSWKLSMKFPIRLLGVSKLFFAVLPLYYLLVFPFCLILNFADVRIKHQKGTGLIVKASK